MQNAGDVVLDVQKLVDTALRGNQVQFQVSITSTEGERKREID